MRATYYDGRTAHAHDVELSIEDGYVIVTGDGVDRRDPEGSVTIMDAIGATPRILRFVGGASCEVTDRQTFIEMLAANGLTATPVSRWELSWQTALGSLIAVACAAVIGYVYVLPAMARSAADRLPPGALVAMSARLERALDALVFEPSQLSEGRQNGLRSLVRDLKLPDGSTLPLDVRFRRSEAIGANALALPSGTIILTDGLVALLDDDRLLMAVVAHEAGHVQRRHGVRKVIQSSVVGVLMTWYLGDIGAIGVAAPTALLDAKYSRDLERAADDYAVQTLRLNGIAPSFLADALRAIDTSHETDAAGGMTYLSSHPATTERLERLRQR